MTCRPLHDLPAAGVRYLLFDIDDTFTQHAQVHALAFQALEHWQATGRLAIAVTGRPAGWCDHIARMWPVDGVIGENGAFWFRRQMHQGQGVGIERRLIGQPAPGADLTQRLQTIQDLILKEFPAARISADQPYRLFDLAIDFAEDVHELTLDDAHRIAQRLQSLGLNAKVSSIHVNAWFGDHNKCQTVRQYLQACHGLTEAEQNACAVYVGDSPNDEPLFESFPLSVGVANVAPFLSRMNHPPRFLTRGAQALGFRELVEHLLQAA